MYHIPLLRNIVHSIPSVVIGALVAIVAITSALSLVSVIFPENLISTSSVGVKIALIGVIVLGFYISWRSKDFTIAEPQDTIAVFLMIMATSVHQQLTASGNPGQILPTIIILIIISTILMGVGFFALGYFKLGFLVRFIPYPIVGGFLAGAGWILIWGSIKVITDVELHWKDLPVFLESKLLWQLSAGIMTALILLIVDFKYKNFFAMPLTLIVLFISFLISQQFLEIPPYWFLGPFQEGGELNLPISIQDFQQAQWGIIFDQAPNLLGLVFTASIALLLNLTGLELVKEQEIDFNRELKISGLGNILTGFLGGLGGYQSLSLSTLGHQLGVNNRLVGIVTSIIALICYGVGLSLFTFIPKFILGGVLMYIGALLLFQWVYDAWFKLPRLDYALVITILMVIALIGFLEGVITGIVIASIIFIIQYSRISVIKHILTGESYQSNVDRSLEQQQLLIKKGKQIYIIQLHGFLFFGTSYDVIQHLQNRIADPNSPKPLFIVFDFRLVTGMDSSSLLNLIRLKQIAKAHAIQLIFSQTNKDLREGIKKIEKELNHEILIFPTLDFAVAWCEDQILKLNPESLKDNVTEKFFLSLHASKFMQYLTKKTYQEGEFLIKQGEAANELYFIDSGQVSAFIDFKDGTSVRLRLIGGGTVVGELGFFLNLPRSASVTALRETVVYSLTKKAMAEMSKNDPHLTVLLQKYLIDILAERVLHSNRSIQALIQ